MPWPVIDYLAGQLGIGDASVVKRYTERQMTPCEHAWAIQAARGYRDFSDPRASSQLREFMDGRAWTHAEGPLALFEQTTGWLRRNRVLLPGVSVLTRLVVTVRHRVGEGAGPGGRGEGHRGGRRGGVRSAGQPAIDAGSLRADRQGPRR